MMKRAGFMCMALGCPVFAQGDLLSSILESAASTGLGAVINMVCSSNAPMERLPATFIRAAGQGAATKVIEHLSQRPTSTSSTCQEPTQIVPVPLPGPLQPLVEDPEERSPIYARAVRSVHFAPSVVSSPTTPLQRAAMRGHVEALKNLLKNGSYVDLRDASNCTAAYFAAENGQISALKMLCTAGASVKHRNLEGQGFLHAASRRGHINVLQFLIDQGEDIEDCDHEGRTPLHLASEAGTITAVGFLLKEGANIEARTHQEMTPLHCAASHGHAGLCQLLLDKGAAAEARTPQNETALTIAERLRRVEVCQVLRGCRHG